MSKREELLLLNDILYAGKKILISGYTVTEQFSPVEEPNGKIAVYEFVERNAGRIKIPNSYRIL